MVKKNYDLPSEDLNSGDECNFCGGKMNLTIRLIDNLTLNPDP